MIDQLPELKVGQLWQCRNQSRYAKCDRLKTLDAGEGGMTVMVCTIYESRSREPVLTGKYYLMEPKQGCYVRKMEQDPAGPNTLVVLLHDPPSA